MKTLFIAATIFAALSAQAFAEDAGSSRKDAVTVFPPITQSLEYTYSMSLRKPATSPAAGNLAQSVSTADATLTEASPQTH